MTRWPSHPVTDADPRPEDQIGQDGPVGIGQHN
jgi:hypothetical protein